MTIQEMHTAFLLELKAQGAHEDYVPGEIDTFLNRAVRSFVDEQKPLLRESDVTLSNLRTLVQTEELDGADITPHSLFDNTVAADLQELSNSFEYAVAGRAKITGESTKGLLFLGFERFIDEISGEDHSPVFRRLPATIEGSTLIVVFDDEDAGIEGVYLTYLRPPAVLSYSTPTSSDLPVHTHQEIVSRAVILARAAIAETE